ncbi:MAG TPA: PAS domain S-box protein [Anaerolineae bacterium]|nr:PAS domain S-box protein [Anaerolineae bacterium]
MSVIFELIAQLSRPPGGLVYHLITLFAIEASLGMALGRWRRVPHQRLSRLIVAFGGLLLARGVLVALALLSQMGFLTFSALAPPLEHFFDIAAVILLCWAFVLPTLQLDAKVSPIFLLANLSVATALCLVLTPLWWSAFSLDPTLNYSRHWQMILWECWQILLLGLACSVLMRRKSEEQSLLLGAFGCLLGGHLLQLFYPPALLHIAGWERLATLVAYPLLAVVVYRSVHAELDASREELRSELSSYVQDMMTISKESLRQRQEFSTLLETGRMVNASLDLAEVLQRAVDSIALGTNADYGVIALLEPSSDDQMRVLVGYDPLGRPDWEASDIRFSLSRHHLIEHAIRRRRQIIFQEMQESSQLLALHALLGSVEMGPLIVQPLVHKGESLGVIILSNSRTKRRFTQEDGRLCEALASQMTAAIANARLYQHVTELLRTRQEEASQRRAILESIADGVVVADARGRIIMANAAAERIFETSRAELIGRGISQVYKGLFQEEGASPGVTPPFRAGFLQSTFDLGEKTIRASLAPVYLPESDPSAALRRDSGQGPGRELLGTVAVFRDITREAEAERAKSRFIATVSHELRTPMTSVKGYLDLLIGGMAGEINATQKRFLSTIKINADRMINIINNMIYISDLDRAPLQLGVKPTNVAEQLNEAVAAMREQLEARDLALSLEVADDLPPARADPTRLRQILDNLLSNACKFTYPGGQIRIGARFCEGDGMEEDSAGFLLVFVADTGVGIAPEEQERIFEPFYCAESPLEVEAAGVGVGLTIVRSLVQAHGGRIWVESEPGQGSVFYFTLPLSEQRDQIKDSHLYPQKEESNYE